jgi:hypothetical protein
MVRAGFEPLGRIEARVDSIESRLDRIEAMLAKGGNQSHARHVRSQPPKRSPSVSMFLESRRVERLEQTVREGFAEHSALINLLLKQRADDRVLADQRHAEVMAQFEKLATRPRDQ